MTKPSPVDELLSEYGHCCAGYGCESAAVDGRPDEAKAQLHKLILDELPVEVVSFPNKYNEDEMTGWNHAIKDVRQSLKDLFVYPKPSKRPKV